MHQELYRAPAKIVSRQSMRTLHFEKEVLSFVGRVTAPCLHRVTHILTIFLKLPRFGRVKGNFDQECLSCRNEFKAISRFELTEAKSIEWCFCFMFKNTGWKRCLNGCRIKGARYLTSTVIISC